ncbi:FkbM family methyltransferase [Planktothrix agardhii]|uniref:FkbM family methyltransferase n=1 Tax=Planktothrix agardhii TaxID=1160 RepID=UPI001EEED82F|nr:FkbM family methyltransferase [Planktothrix agardhii]MCF3569779.1 FkbM family methyltransferase [Planktothrix agardhii 1805]MCF3587109.1 FkbM family methyltransferase [Planktothrix agardhii 1803]
METQIIRPQATLSMKLNFPDLCQHHNITPRGIILIGAYDGKTLKRLNLPNTVKILVIDANQGAVERLQENFADSPNIQVVQAAIANHNDTVTLHLTSLESSSSILPWKQYSEIYPNIKEIQQLTLSSRTLDTLLEELNLSPSDFNILILDIQGAELLALEGANQLLNTLDAIYTNVHYQELFEGGALAEEVNQFLSDYKFDIVAEDTPYHPAWGEAFYVRQTVRTEDGIHPVKPLSPIAKQLQETKQELEQSQTNLKQTQTELEQSQTNLRQTQTELEQTQNQNQQLQTELKQSQTILEQSQTELEQSQINLKQTQTELEQTQNQNQQLQTELKQSQTILEQSQTELEQSQTNLKQTQTELEQTQNQNQQLQTELKQSQTILEQSQTELEQTQTNLKQTQTELEQSQNQNQQLQTELKQSQTILEQSQTELEQSQINIKQTQKEFDQSRSELHEVREELELTQFQLDEVQVELEQYVSQFHQQKEEITKLKTELEQAKTQLTQVQYQPEITVSKKSKSDNAAIVKLLAKVLAETMED